jgi:hypothetical protein
VYPKNLRGAALISIGSFEHALDEFLLKLSQRLLQQYAPLYHHSHQRFQLLFHVCTLSGGDPVLRSIECVAGDALIGFSVFLARGFSHIRRKRRRRWLLVPSDLLEVIAYVLLVERELRLTG